MSPIWYLVTLLAFAVVGAADLAAFVAARAAIARAFRIPGVRFSVRLDPSATLEGVSPWARPACAFASLAAIYLITSAMAAGAFYASGRTELPYWTTVDVLPGKPAEVGGIRNGDRVTAIASEPVDTWQKLAEAFRKHPGEAVEVTVERDGQTVRLQVTPGPKGTPSEGKVGLMIHPRHVEMGVGESIGKGLAVPVQVLWNVGKGLARIVTGDLTSEVGGPVGIVQANAKRAESRVGPVLIIMSSINAYTLPLFALLGFALLPPRRRAPAPRAADR